jgi:hypothetical protein
MITLRQAVVLLLLPVIRAAAQNVPAASAPVPYTGFELPDASGTLRVSLNASERFTLGYNGSSDNTNGYTFSGLGAYLSNSPLHPFSAVYTGSYISGNSQYPSQVLSNLALSQVLPLGRWKVVVADAVSYSPENPVSGLTGIPGLGDGNTSPLTGSTTGDIQTINTTLLNNRVSGTASYSLTGATSLSATAAQSIMRYLDVPGGSTTDENEYTLSGGLNQQINANTSAGIRYSYANYSYLTSDLAVRSQSVTVNGSRTITPYLSVSGGIGPQYTSSSEPTFEPSSLTYSANGVLTYHNSLFNATINASRGISGGSGLVAETESNIIGGRVDRQIGALIHVSANASYASYSSLQAGTESTQSLVVGGQANRSIAAHISAFISYTLQRQLDQGTDVSSLILNGTTQTLAFGISYTPTAFNIGHH